MELQAKSTSGSAFEGDFLLPGDRMLPLAQADCAGSVGRVTRHYLLTTFGQIDQKRRKGDSNWKDLDNVSPCKAVVTRGPVADEQLKISE